MYSLTIETLYNEYHRETFKVQHGFYPRQIKNFNLDDSKKEFLNRFLRFCKKNVLTINPTLYIRACAEFFKYPFKMSVLGSLKGTRIYNEYISLHKEYMSDTDDFIVDAIKTSFITINNWLDENENASVLDYFRSESGILPTFVFDLANRKISPYIFACIHTKEFKKMCSGIDDFAFSENVLLSVEEFMTDILEKKRIAMFRSERLRRLFDKAYAILNK